MYAKPKYAYRKKSLYLFYVYFLYPSLNSSNFRLRITIRYDVGKGLEVS